MPDDDDEVHPDDLRGLPIRDGWVTGSASLVDPDDRPVPEEVVAGAREIERQLQRRDHITSGSTGVAEAGLTCMITGKSATANTFAAHCLAAELGLNLYRVDLSQVVSKYIGDTEKALGRVFDEVEAGNGLLLFDEADALFGRRTSPEDATRRHAMDVLLRRLKNYSGVVVVTIAGGRRIDDAIATLIDVTVALRGS